MSTTYFFDVGNTRGKFWRCQGGVVDARAEIVHQGDMAGMLQQLPAEFKSSPAVLQGASVLAPEAREAFAQAAQHCWGLTPLFAVSTASHTGVVSAYRNTPSRLGIDRWLALIAVRSRQQSVCVVDCGTAITLDVITPAGQHLGGYILPGLNMMADALLAGTQGVRYTADEAGTGTALGGSTAEAVTHGALAAVVALVDRLVLQHQAQLVLTGGDAQRLAAALTQPYDLQSELLLQGLQRYFADTGIK